MDRHLVGAALPTMLLAACAIGATAPSATSPSASAAESQALQPLVVGWEQFFKLDWQAGERKGRPVVFGHIYNNWGKAAVRMQLLAEGLNSAGHVTEQELGWLPAMLTPGTTAAFEIPLREPAAAYRVSVFAFDWLERGRKMP